MNKVKKATYILIAVLIIATLTSCGKEQPSVTYSSLNIGAGVQDISRIPEATDMIAGQNYTSGQRLCYLERNRLKIDTISESKDGLYYYVLQRIDGLVDTQIQSTVNDKISKTALDWCLSRPLTGESITETLSKDTIKNACYGACTNITLNCSDYFSGVIVRTIDYYDTATGSHSLFTYDYPINFDLRTGEEFSLSSLFCDDADYMNDINSAITRYAKDNALSLKNFNGLSESCAFSLSEDGVVIYMDDNGENNGLASGTAITIDYSAFGDTLVLQRSCSDIYVDEDTAGVKLIRSSKSSQASTSTVYYDEGDKLSVKVAHTSPQGFPETLFEAADKYISAYIPEEKAAEKVRADESAYLRLSCDINGYYIGSYSCVTLNCSIKKSGEFPFTASRSFVYDSSGNEISIEKCFADDFDTNTYVSGILANAVNKLIDEGWTIEEEIDVEDIDFALSSDRFSLSTLPVRMTKKTISPEGFEESETKTDSITVDATFDEISAESLAITQL